MPELQETEKPAKFVNVYASVRVVKQPRGKEPDVVATVTNDRIDADKEIVLPGGCDLSRFVKAPRIMLCHAYGRPGDYYPLPIGKALWTKREGNSLMQGIRFAQTPMAKEVAELFRDEMLNTFSIGFISEDNGPPTKQEKIAHPEWAKAELIHRRWKLLEVSVAPIPSNEDAIGRWVGKGRTIPKFLWLSDGKGGYMAGQADVAERPSIENGTLVKLNALAGGGWGIVKALHLGTVPDVDEDNTDGSNDWAVKVGILDLEGKEIGTVGALYKHVEPLADKSYHGMPWMGVEAEKSSHYRLMAKGLLERHAKIMHSGKQGHLYAHEPNMEAYLVRHKSDDMEGKGHHTAEQCKSMLEGAPGCKSVTVSYEHPPDQDAWEMLHPSPPGTNVWQARSITAKGPVDSTADEPEMPDPVGAPDCPMCGEKGMMMEGDAPKAKCTKCDHVYEVTKEKALAESSGSSGGYLVPPEQLAAGNQDDRLEEATAPYMPKPGTVVGWESHEGMHAGAGRVKSLHKNGRVPGVYNSDAVADEKNVHAKIHLFKKNDDETYDEPEDGDGHHVAVHTKHLRALPMLRSGTKSMDKSVVPFKSGPEHDGAWDAAAARSRIAKWASSDGSGDKDKMDWRKYDEAFTVITGPADDFGSAKLPHHDVVNGQLVVSRAGVKAALGALGGARGGMKLSEEERSAAEAHLKKHEGAGDEKKDADEPELKTIPKFQTVAQYRSELIGDLKRNQAEPITKQRLLDEVLAQMVGAVESVDSR